MAQAEFEDQDVLKPNSALQFSIVPTSVGVAPTPLHPPQAIDTTSTTYVTLGLGTYTLFVSTLGTSQYLAFDNPENVDVPYTLLIA